MAREIVEKRIVLVYDNPGEGVVDSVRKFLEDFTRDEEGYVLQELFQEIRIGQHVEKEVERLTQDAIVILIYNENNDNETQAAAIANAASLQGVLGILKSGNRRGCILVVPQNYDRSCLPNELRICALMESFDKILLLCYLACHNYPLYGTLELYNAGYTMAVGYLEGYVNHVYQELREKMETTELYKQRLLSVKFHILLPKSGNMPDEGFADGRRIFLTEGNAEHDSVTKSHGGVTERIYRYNFYKFHDQEGKEYVAHAEYATPLSILPVMMERGLLPNDPVWLQQEMDNYAEILNSSPECCDIQHNIRYDDKAPGWNSGKLADLILRYIKSDLGEAAEYPPSQKLAPISRKAMCAGVSAGEEEPIYDVFVLPPSPSAKVDFVSVFQALDEIRTEGTNRFAPETPLGGHIITTLSENVLKSRNAVVIVADSDLREGHGGEWKMVLQDALAGIIDGSLSSLVLITDHPVLSNISPYFTRFFLKRIDPTNRSASSLKGELSKLLTKVDGVNPLLSGIKYLYIGKSLAMQYFYSYLEYKLTEFHKLYEGRSWSYKGRPIPMKLFVVLQRSGSIDIRSAQCPEPIYEEKDYLPKTLARMRGGARRDYPSTLWRIEHNGKKYYAVLEFIANMRTIEIVATKYQLGDKWKTSEVELYQETLTRVMLHERNLCYRNRFKLVVHDDAKPNASLASDLVDALLQDESYAGDNGNVEEELGSVTAEVDEMSMGDSETDSSTELHVDPIVSLEAQE